MSKKRLHWIVALFLLANGKSHIIFVLYYKDLAGGYVINFSARKEEEMIMKKIIGKENVLTNKAMAQLKNGKVTVEKKTRNSSETVTFFEKDGICPYVMTTLIQKRTAFKKGSIIQTDAEIGVPVSHMANRINRLLNSGYVLKIS